MSKPHSDVAYLCHILDEANFLIHSAKNINLEQFKQEPTLKLHADIQAIRHASDKNPL